MQLSSTSLAGAIVQTMDQPLLILSGDLVVEEANSAFYRLFGVAAEETRGRLLYELGNGQWDVPDLRRLLEEILPRRSVVEHYRIEHAFPGLGRRIMVLNARRLPPEGGRQEMILLAISDRTEAEQLRFELEGQVEFGEKLVDSVREALLVLDRELRVVRANQSFYNTFRVSADETLGRLVFELGNRQWDIPRLRELLENVLPDNNAFDDVEVVHEFEHLGRRVMLLNGRRLDHLELVLLAIRDVTELRRMETEREVVMGELHHRIKNVLTSVNAMAKQTLRQSRSLEEFGSAFEGRVQAMAGAQNLLMRAPQATATIEDILRLELEAHGGREASNFDLEGPAVSLPQDAVQVFTMAMHELTTNALKHGALASPEGHVGVAWRVEPVDGGGLRVRFRWREQCPLVSKATGRTGYGSRVLESVFGHSLKGSSHLAIHADGAEFTAEFLL